MRFHPVRLDDGTWATAPELARLNVFELFAGIGGIGLGLERAGMTVVGQVEIDPFCQGVLAKHWPEVPRHDDVRTCVDWWRGEPRPRVDLIAGGFPCQPVSVAGRRLAQDDDRWLWPAMAGVIRALRPRYVLLENVPGLLTRGMGDVLGALAACGYDTEWDCIPAAAIGANHRRDRLFIIAHSHSDEHESGAPAIRRSPTTDVPSGTVADPNREGQLQPGGRVGEEWRRLGDSGAEGPAVAHPDSQPRDEGRPSHATEGTRGRNSHRGSGHEDELADTDSPGQQPWRRLGRTWPTPIRDSWWAAEPDVGRVAYGIPRRVDRLRALGNAVVPQVAEHIGHLILAAADEARSAA